MEIKCPQCGRIFEVPDNKVSRSYKCVCKFTFRYGSKAKITRNVTEEEPKSPSTNLESSVLANHDFEEDSVSESDISDVEIDTYLQDLRQSRAEIKERESQKEELGNKNPVETPLSHQIEIELERSTTNESDENSEPIFEETSESRLPPIDFHLPRAKTPKEQRLSLAEHAKNFFKSKTGQLSLVSFGIIGILVAVVFWILSPGPEQKKQDPYLAELLKGSESLNTQKHESRTLPEEPKETENNFQSTQQRELPQVPEPKIAITKRPSVKPPSSVSKPAPRKNIDFEKLSLHGQYEKLVEAAGTRTLFDDTETESFFYEASFLASTVSHSNKVRLKQKLDHRWESTKASSLARAQAVYHIATRNDFEAVKALKGLQLTRSRDPFVFAFLALAYENMKRPKLSLNSYSQALTLQPNFPWVLSRSSRLAYLSKQYDLALNLSERLAKVSPEFKHQAHYQLGLIYLDQKNYSTAEKHLDQSIKSKEQFGPRYTLGQILLSRNPKKAEVNFARAVDLAENSRDKRNAYFYLGQAQCRSKNHKAASISFRKAVAEDSSFVKAWEEKAKCETQLGLFESASKTYQSILKSKPQDANVWLMYGSSLRQAKRSKPALAAVKRSLELKDSDAGHYELALVYLSLNRKSEAAYHAKRAFRMNPNNKKAKTLSASLE